MKPKDLKNYGKSLLEMMGNVPHEMQQKISDTGFGIINKYLNSDDQKRFAVSMEMEKEKMLERNFSTVSEKGLNSKEFIHQQIDWAASFITASKIVGREKALNIHREITEKTYPKLFFNMFTAPEELKGFDDPFVAFKEWFLALMDANRNVGLFDYNIVEDTEDAFQMDCIWCVWHETYKQLGAGDACIPVCHADDAFYPDYFQQTNIKYKRTQTLGWGDNRCDFRFERSIIESF